MQCIALQSITAKRTVYFVKVYNQLLNGRIRFPKCGLNQRRQELTRNRVYFENYERINFHLVHAYMSYTSTKEVRR